MTDNEGDFRLLPPPPPSVPVQNAKVIKIHIAEPTIVDGNKMGNGIERTERKWKTHTLKMASKSF